MKKVIFLTFLVVSLNSLIAQNENGDNFSKFEHNHEKDYYYCIPKDYDNSENSQSEFPLIIYLHGGGGYGKLGSLDFLGYGGEDEPLSPVAKEFQMNYPSFILVPQAKQRGWEPSIIIEQVEEIRNKYRIDKDRIYLIGYSMGGSGTFPLANAYYEYNKTLFAAIMRFAGQSRTTLKDEIINNSSIWLHIGLEDNPERIEVARDYYNDYKRRISGLEEKVEQIKINDVAGSTASLFKKGTAIIRKTEYNETGHGISRFPFNDKNLMVWLFSQKLN